MRTKGGITGIAEAACKAILERLGITSGGTYTPGGSSSSVEEWDAEVETLTALNSALVDGARVLLTADIAVSGANQINLFSGRCTIGRKPGVQIIQTGTANLFQLGSAATCDVTLVSLGEDKEKLPFIDTSGGTPTYLVSGDSGALVRLKGDVGIKANASLTLRGVCGLDIDADELTIECPNNALTIGAATIRADRMNLIGGGSSSRLTAMLSTTAASKIDAVRVSGSWRQVSSSPLSEFAIQFGGELDVGPITGSFGSAGYVLIDEGVVCRRPHITQGGLSVRDAQVIGGYTPSLQTATATSSTRAKTLIQGLVFDAWAYTTSPATYRNCRLPTSTPQTLGSGSEPDFQACIVPSGTTINFSSGSQPKFDDCELDGTIVLDSGAAARITNMRNAGGTLTNNDPLSVVILSEDPSWDTTPSTRRFNNATLDAILDRLAAHYDLTASDLAFIDKSPAQRYRPIQGARSTGITAGAGGVVFGDTGDWAAGGEFSFLADANFSLGFNFTPTDATPAANRILVGLNTAAGSAGVGIDNNTSGGVSLFSDSSYRITGAAALSDGVESYIELVRRHDSGTNTWHLFVDGVDVGSSTGGIVDIIGGLILLGRFNLSLAANANPGTMNSLSLWDIGHSDAQAVAMAANPELIGAGL